MTVYKLVHFVNKSQSVDYLHNLWEPLEEAFLEIFLVALNLLLEETDLASVGVLREASPEDGCDGGGREGDGDKHHPGQPGNQRQVRSAQWQTNQ